MKRYVCKYLDRATGRRSCCVVQTPILLRSTSVFGECTGSCGVCVKCLYASNAFLCVFVHVADEDSLLHPHAGKQESTHPHVHTHMHTRMHSHACVSTCALAPSLLMRYTPCEVKQRDRGDPKDATWTRRKFRRALKFLWYQHTDTPRYTEPTCKRHVFLLFHSHAGSHPKNTRTITHN